MPASLSPLASRAPRLLSLTLLLSMTASPGAMAANLGFAPGPAGLDYYSIQNLLIGATMPLQQSANYGKNVTVGTLDTGIESSWVGFGGLTISSYSCLNGVCGTAAANSDDNGHGTFVASEIIGGAQFSNGNGMLGIAPLANEISVKVLDASGSGNSVDVANGIKYAVDNGAKILNLSLGPTGTQAQQIAFYNSLASAINYAASKNAVIVFAGGNTGTSFVDGGNIGSSNPKLLSSNLFTNAALERMFFVGATNSQDQHAWYSTQPSSGGFYSSTGQFFSYKSMWLVADGGGISNGQCIDCVVGAPNVANANYLALDAGTSMAAPQGVGSAALLAARWPQLLAQGTIPAILEQTATSLGSATLYGDGLINLAKAFQPIGGTYAITQSGGSVSVSSGGSSALASGALGSMSKISGILSNYTIFDSFQRDFSVNLSSLIATRGSSSPAGQSIGAPKITTGATHFADGSSLAFSSMTDDSPAIDHPGNGSDNKGWFMSFTDASGSTVAAGSGFPASASFADAMWGNNQVSGAVYGLGVSNTLLNLAQGGNFVALGNQLGENTRIAFSWTQTLANSLTGNDSGNAADWTQPNATSFGTGINTLLTDNWKAGVTFGLLDEQSGLLGTSYAPNGPLDLGANHRSMSLGISSVFALGDKRDLLIDAAMVRTDGGQSDGLISSVSPLYARTFGAALVQHDTLKNGDNLSFSVRAPLRVISGSATIATTSVDSNGIATSGAQRVSLTPSGNEMDFSMGYTAPVSEMISWNASLDARRNIDNIQGSNDEDFLVGTKITF